MYMSTADLIKHGIDFRLFVLEEAGLFDRDHPERIFVPKSSPYYREELAKANQALRRAKKGTLGAAMKSALRAALEKFVDATNQYSEDQEDWRIIRKNLLAMMQAAEGWNSPVEVPDLKQRVLDELQKTHDRASNRVPKRPDAPKPVEALSSYLDQLQWYVEYSGEKLKEERENFRKDNRRIAATLKSVGLTRSKAETLKRKFLRQVQEATEE